MKRYLIMHHCTLLTAVRHHGPWLLVALISGAIFFIPGASAVFQYDRLAIARGEIWRIWTGHLCHFGFEHLGWDLVTFCFLGALCCRNDQKHIPLLILGSATLISAGVFLLHPEMRLYRGLSGIDSALFVYLATVGIRNAMREQDGKIAFVYATALLAFLAKIIYELFTAQSVFVDSHQADMIPVPLAHVLGAAVGVLTNFVPTTTQKAVSDPSPIAVLNQSWTRNKTVAR